MRRQHGFTLVEMIVALAVSALLVSLTYGALRLGVRSWEASQYQADRIDTLRLGWQAVDAALAETVPIADRFSDQNAILFEGRPQRLRFAANMPSFLGLGGMYVIDLYRDEQADELPFRLRRTLYAEYLQQGLESNTQQADLAEQVQQLSFSYFGKQADDTDPGWHTSWKEQNTLPTLVRIEVELENGDHWPTLVAWLRRGNRGGDELAFDDPALSEPEEPQ